MKRTRANAGYTLIELLVTIVIIVLLTLGIGAGMNVGARVYRDSIFQSNSAMLADTVNTSLEDVLRYSKNAGTADGKLVFTNTEFGIQDGYFQLSDGILQIYNPMNDSSVELVNTGAYPQLKISDFSISYVSEGGYYKVSYKIYSTLNQSLPAAEALTRDIETAIRILNN